MPGNLDASDRRLLIGAAAVMLVLVVATYALGPAPSATPAEYPSSYSPAWAGAKAAFLLLQDVGYQAVRWDRPPADLPENPRGSILILADPFAGGASDDRMAIRTYLYGGGRVLAIGASATALIPDAEAYMPETWDPDTKKFSALVPSPVARQAPEIAMAAPDVWTSHKPGQLAIYGTNDQPVVVSYHVGKGEIIWWASATPLTNSGIRQSDNLTLFLNSIGLPSGAPVYWDEYFHGQRASFGDYFAKTPLPWAALQLGIAFLAILFTFSRRSGPARAPVAEPRLSPLEFVETLGDLYHSAHASPAAVSVASQRFHSSLARRLRAPTKWKLPELSRAAAKRFGWPEAPLLDTLARSERAMRSIQLDEKEALDLVQRLHDYSARLAPAVKKEPLARGEK